MADRHGRFRHMYDEHYVAILGYALRRTDSAEDAADVVAETFTVAWRRLDDVPEGDRTRLWLYGTARKVLGNHHRSQRRRRLLAERLRADLPPLIAQVAAGADDAALLGDIRAAFTVLTPADRDVLLLAAWEQLDAGGIAEVLGCSRATARVRLHRARKRFAAALARDGLQHPPAAGHEPTGRAAARPGTEGIR